MWGKGWKGLARRKGLEYIVGKEREMIYMQEGRTGIQCGERDGTDWQEGKDWNTVWVKRGK